MKPSHLQQRLVPYLEVPAHSFPVVVSDSEVLMSSPVAAAHVGLMRSTDPHPLPKAAVEFEDC